jgi:epsilon-lactone hydrolase
MAEPSAIDRANALYAGVFDPELELSVPALRARFEAMMATFPVPDDAAVEEVEAGGVPSVRVAAGDVVGGRAIVWFHSGGYVLGSAHGHRSFAAALSRASGRPVLMVDYRRAPEAAFPAAVDDAEAALSATIDELGAKNVVVGGDSAGGALTISALCRRRTAGGAQPAAAVLLSPLLDLGATGASIELNAATDVAVTRAGIRSIVAAYLQGQDRLNPEASPIGADVAGLPPTLVLAGGAEILLDDSRRIADRMTAAGTAAQLLVYPGMCHAWPLFETFLPEGRQAIDEISAFIQAAEGSADTRTPV